MQAVRPLAYGGTMKRTLFFIASICLLYFSNGVALAEELSFKQTLKDFIAIALENNPALREAQDQIRVSQEIPSQAGSLDDPVLRFALKNLPVDTFAFDQEPVTQKEIVISQKLPFPGKLGLRTEMAQKNVDIAEENLEELKHSVIRQVKQSYFELCFVLAAIDITRQNKTLLEQFVTITESKYSVGKGLQQDVLKAQVELSKIRDELIKLDKLKESEKAKLNSLMDLMPQAPLTIPHGIAKTSFTYKIEELQALAEKHRPILEEFRLQKERYLVSRKLAEKEYYPNFNVGFKYGQREDGAFQDRPDFVSAFVGINIPLWHKTKQSRKVAEQGYRVQVAQEGFHKAKNRIFLRIKELMDEEKRGTETLQLIGKGILPQARQSLESAIAGYGVDKVDFLTLLDNQVTLLRWETQYHQELTDYEKNLAELEQVVGKTLF